MTFPQNDASIKIKKGFPVCPRCGCTVHQTRIRPETMAVNLENKCDTCKLVFLLDIRDGTAKLSSGQRIDCQRP